jgi:hypothetical protein
MGTVIGWERQHRGNHVRKNVSGQAPDSERVAPPKSQRDAMRKPRATPWVNTLKHQPGKGDTTHDHPASWK